MLDPLNEGAGRPEAQTPAPTHRSQSRSQVGRWVVDPDIDEISSPGQVVKLEPRTMRLLLYLMEHRHRVVALKELLDHVWANVVVTPQSVYSTIAQLRQALGDSTDSPAYIATVPRKGYRLLATVTALPADATARAAVAAVATASAPTSSPAAVASAGRRPPWSLALLACLIGILILIYQHDLRRLPSPATPPVPAASIAVMPFLDLSEKQDAPYLADGMTEELIDILAHDQMLRVPARTSSFYSKGRTETVAAIASQLNVANLLEARLTPGLRSASAERASSASHNLSLECQLYRERNTVADADRAVDCFHRLIDLNSDSARAWAAYADALMRQPMLANAAIEAQRAGAIESVKAARRALGLDPDSATALAKDLGHLDEFIALCERARINDPLNFQPYARLAGAYLYLGRLGEAEAMARRRLDLAPAGSGSRAGLAEVLLARGQAQAALVEIAQEPLDELRSFGYAKIYDALGRRPEADAALNDVTARFSDRNPTHIAETLAFRGDTDRAFEFLDRAAASGDREILGIKSNFYFRRMHADPRYRRILERVSLPVSQ